MTTISYSKMPAETKFMDDYWKTQEEYEKKYGPNTALWIEKGYFMECYGTETKGKAKILSKMLNIMLTKSNKNLVLDDTNPYMIGFPTDKKSKNLPILLNNDMYIIWKTQIVDEQGRTIGREVTRIYTPGTYINDVDDIDYNFVCCIAKQYGICIIDVSLGQVYIRDYNSIEDANRIIDGYNPREIILMDTDFDTVNKCMVTRECGNTFYYDTTYQNEVFHKIYKGQVLHLCEVYKNASAAFVRLLTYINICYPQCIEVLDMPKMIENNDSLLLHNNAVSQLNILRNNSNGEKNSLFNIIDHTSTAMGHRELKKRLIHPYTCPLMINKSYNDIEEIQKNDSNNHIYYTIIQQVLENIPDIQRIIHKIKLKSIYETDVIKLLQTVQKLNIELPIKYKPSYLECIASYIQHYFITTNGELQFVGAEKLQKLKDEEENIKSDIHKKLNVFNDIFHNYKIKLEYQEKDGYVVNSTSKKAEILQKNFKEIRLIKCSNTICKISTNNLDNWCYRLNQLKSEYKKEYQIIMEEYIELFLSKFENEINTLITYITDLDITACFACIANKYQYNRPVIKDGLNSMVHAENIRHPIIEHLDINYVTNDATFDNYNLGLLLYGINGSGKSCYGRSIALNIILAQIGCFVPCTKFEFTPYNHLFTRINCDDNMYQGMSSFFVEMVELRSIIQLANKNSIIIGDEMCKGTEDLSATSLVEGAIEWMIHNQVQFIFATHLHKLQYVEFIKDSKNIQINI